MISRLQWASYFVSSVIEWSLFVCAVVALLDKLRLSIRTKGERKTETFEWVSQIDINCRL